MALTRRSRIAAAIDAALPGALKKSRRSPARPVGSGVRCEPLEARIVFGLFLGYDYTKVPVVTAPCTNPDCSVCPPLR